MLKATIVNGFLKVRLTQAKNIREDKVDVFAAHSRFKQTSKAPHIDQVNANLRSASKLLVDYERTGFRIGSNERER